MRSSDGTIRPYTPVSLKHDRGFFELAIKSYPDGKVSSELDFKQIGDEIEVRGPFEKLPYIPNIKRNLGMIAGGTGITPMIQILREINQHLPIDRTKVKLLFANHEEDDIILRSELDHLQSDNPNIEILHILSSPSPQWIGYKGRINRDILRAELPESGSDTLIYVCGPPGMMEAVCGDKLPNKEQGPLVGILKELGYDGDEISRLFSHLLVESMVYKF